MRSRSERGSAVLELTLITPLLLMLLVMVVAFGRITLAKEDVTGAARDAARAASQQRNANSAAVTANTTGTKSLQSGRVTCRTSDIRTDTSEFRPGGWVTVDVTCNTDLGALSLLNLPGSKSIHAQFVEPIDTFRGAA